ncbi:MAG: hypothetical protein WDN45_11315 [Caulobacteraceae bacterium]
MSTLTSLGYTASQYALLSSVYSIAGKFLKGISGVVGGQPARPRLQPHAVLWTVLRRRGT